MSGYLNEVTLIGNLGADPEIRRTQDGRPIASLRLATTESWRDRNTGEKREKTERHSVVVFNEQLCKVIEQYVHKGDKILVRGQLATRKWQDQNGNDRYSTEIVLQGFNAFLTMLLGRREGYRAGDGASEYGYDGDRAAGSSSSSSRQSTGPGSSRDFNDDIPF
ncbi:single-stranded DNA-binding protein [Sinorhizobium medicae]|uniref:single-stranded DNA-binding protein n=1 Tax=Sinorhizobium medicae TaxID=110321 RepID=UPI000C7CE858|nr:single-stranded DNA-binding protein [Sinorhizobium medicae]MDX0665803.1 single-stranded DNA-binding protein [Sinorhizobium medicae]MDX0764662.1 single-stranded DNA-binding protein [Sinorhizobium medicae]MDX0826054.1 single-stranded DNA-binding protein [Sinorhizobium medicae]MDX1151586.1 single-stranded DNA-binding protein [Sinorhizobium medicae]PLU13122.1 single-stranded DNA-binding protein [Sinorhizobium medicae]